MIVKLQYLNAWYNFVRAQTNALKVTVLRIQRLHFIFDSDIKYIIFLECHMIS